MEQQLEQAIEIIEQIEKNTVTIPGLFEIVNRRIRHLEKLEEISELEQQFKNLSDPTELKSEKDALLERLVENVREEYASQRTQITDPLELKRLQDSLMQQAEAKANFFFAQKKQELLILEQKRKELEEEVRQEQEENDKILDELDDVMLQFHPILDRFNHRPCRSYLAQLQQETTPQQKTYTCAQCGTPRTREQIKTCAICLNANYCNRKCQAMHWQKHKRACKKAIVKKVQNDILDESLQTEESIQTVAATQVNPQTFSCCSHCGIEKTPRQIKTCARCHNAGYCSKDCQIADWQKHKQVCARRN